MTKPLYSTIESKAQLLKEMGVEVIEFDQADFWDEDQIIHIRTDCESAVDVLKRHFIDIEEIDHVQPCDKHTGKPQGSSYFALVFAPPPLPL